MVENIVCLLQYEFERVKWMEESKSEIWFRFLESTRDQLSFGNGERRRKLVCLLAYDYISSIFLLVFSRLVLLLDFLRVG